MGEIRRGGYPSSDEPVGDLPPVPSGPAPGASSPASAFDVEPRDVASLPAETLGDLYAAAELAAGALDTLATLLLDQGARLTAAEIKATSIRLDHALRAAQDRTETETGK